MQTVERASWQNPKVLATLVLVFVAGAFSGAVSMRWGLHKRLHPESGLTWRDPKASKAFLDLCKKELNLTPAQADEIGAILDDYKQYYQSLDDIRGTGKMRILQILDDQQKKKLEEMLARDK